MNFHYLTLENCHRAVGCVVVIDVCRAFTTAAYAFANGAERILLTSTIDEAMKLRASILNSRTMGEMNGLPISGFDFWNSPAQLLDQKLTGATLIQRTTAGTQGMVLSRDADVLLASSFVVARATANLVRALKFDEVSFVQTGMVNGAGGEEDAACARYIEALILGKKVDPADYLDWVEGSFGDLVTRDPELADEFRADMACCIQTDRFDFGMRAWHEGNLLVMRAVKV